MTKLLATATLLLTFLVSPLMAVGKVLNQENLQIRNGLYFEVNTRVPFTGKAFNKKYANGQWKVLNYFKEGKVVGTEKFNRNGEISYEEGINETSLRLKREEQIKKDKEAEVARRLKQKEKIKKIKKAKVEIKKQVIKKINSNWNLAPLKTAVDYEKYKVVLEIKIDHRGYLRGPIKNISPYKPEGRYLIAKRSAVNAILASEPFSIPEDLFTDGLTLKIEFDPAEN